MIINYYVMSKKSQYSEQNNNVWEKYSWSQELSLLSEIIHKIKANNPLKSANIRQQFVNVQTKVFLNFFHLSIL